MIPKRDATLFAFVTALHLLASVAVLVYTFGAGMARFDSGATATVPETIGAGLLNTLSFPLLLVLEQLTAPKFPRWWGYIPFVLNASLWGIAAVMVRRLWRRQAQVRS